MELDTGSSVSLIPEKLFESKLKESMPLKRSSVTLRTFTGERVPVLGEAEVKTPSLEELSKSYSVFNGKLGTVKGITASLKVKDNCQPKFFKLRPVPFALKDKIADELFRLEKERVLEKVDSSEWATPIVPVLKPDNTVRICGDYKVTINPILDVPEYPLPTAEEIFSKLNGGQKFSKLDLSHAYQQVLLDEESCKLLTINTHLGL
ncbi:uncharacterized protein K02A2.6-like [Dendronephthya gigantea]|uniref:uncharacterized protein K02A2.6-like n=1 Tax=Dendronephthya gigantea TaxID=151771 RepID=UPI00106B708C|nr:uncharacterized protein K02A2.6-like [Dendronephthya gigantea]